MSKTTRINRKTYSTLTKSQAKRILHQSTFPPHEVEWRDPETGLVHTVMMKPKGRTYRRGLGTGE